MQHIWWVDSRATRQGGGLDAQDIQLNKPGGTPMSYLRGKGEKKVESITAGEGRRGFGECTRVKSRGKG